MTIEIEPVEIHSKEAGWAELPDVAVVRDHAYVAFGVREGHESHVYLSRVARGEGEPAIETIRLDARGKIEFAPALATDHRGGKWIAWTSYRGGRWTIRASYVLGMEPGPEVVISEGEGFASQVRAMSSDGSTWFVWTLWDEGSYSILARRHEGELGEILTVYRGSAPVGRPDLYVYGRDHVVFAWDEYAGRRFTVRTRELRRGELGPVETLPSAGSGNCWEPHVTAAGGNLLTVWHRVPDGSVRCQPAAAASGRLLENGIDWPHDFETWRVRCFRDVDGGAWISWATRFMYRRTDLFLRRIGTAEASQTCEIEFPMQKNFINWFDFDCDGDLTLAWESSGSIFISEFPLPAVGEGAEPAPPEEAASAVEAGGGPPGGRLDYGIDYKGERLSVFFGDDHNHTSFSDGRAYPDISMQLARDHRRLDFICITDHDITLTPGEFAWNNTAADMLTVEGSYVCLHGFEPSKGWAQNGFGHWNLLFPGSGAVMQFEEGMTPRDLQEFTRSYDGVLIPHHVAKVFAPYNWDYFDPGVERVVELCSVHGIFESHEGNEERRDMVEGKFIQDGLARGYRFGFIGASDFHNCFEAMYGEYGLTGVYAAGLDSDAIFEALRKRRTFALTGSRIVVDFRCNGHLMGEEIEGASKLDFTGYAASADSIVSIEIVSGGRTVFSKATSGPDASVAWTVDAPDSDAYFYLKTKTARGDFAWSSPIWSNPGQ
jgi:hypothetical protein